MFCCMLIHDSGERKALLIPFLTGAKPSSFDLDFVSDGRLNLGMKDERLRRYLKIMQGCLIAEAD